MGEPLAIAAAGFFCRHLSLPVAHSIEGKAVLQVFVAIFSPHMLHS